MSWPARIRCLLGIHKWSMWGEVTRETWSKQPTTPFTKVPVGERIRYTRTYQTRRCMDCRVVETNELYE